MPDIWDGRKTKKDKNTGKIKNIYNSNEYFSIKTKD